ncbi:hypothetical protein NLI96_g7336 [Meripilus lineatus]|uniref:DUF6534 domain-containing protein n=1 Tax=Meripilus lineatus TaxID=2056292 RepID=A0AAD5V4L4_9APHY|nr:hypothetical protein NLI96_g7336 [Physisporinus lineatus]
MSSSPELPSNIVQLTGPMFLGNLFSWSLFGVLSLQVYLYYLSFPKDRPFMKALVWTVYLIEVLQIVMSVRDAFKCFGSEWGNRDIMDTIGWQWFSVPILIAFIGAESQIFYAWRIWVLSDGIYIPIFVVLLALFQSAAGIYGAVVSAKGDRFSQISERAYTPTIMWLAGTASCDIVIAASMVYYLRKSKSGFRSTTILLAKVIRVTVETGLVCAAGALIDMGLFLGYPSTNYHLTMCMLLSKLYSNSLLVVLNSRIRIVGGRDESIVPGDSTLSTIRWIHSDVSRATAHGSVHISRLGNDLRQSHPIVDQTDAESMKPLKKVLTADEEV